MHKRPFKQPLLAPPGLATRDGRQRGLTAGNCASPTTDGAIPSARAVFLYGRLRRRNLFARVLRVFSIRTFYLFLKYGRHQVGASASPPNVSTNCRGQTHHEIHRMTRLFSIGAILTLGSTFQLFGQETSKIKGLWECYSSLSDTLDPDNVQLWYRFDDKKMTVLLVPNLGLPPEKCGISSTAKYNLKNDTLRTFYKGRIDMAKVHILNSDLIQISSWKPDEQIQYYLKRIKK